MLHNYDEDKRAMILAERGLDLADAPQVFAGFYLPRADLKHSGVERRTITVGMLDSEEVVLIVWTTRESERRIITMWKANDKERQRYHEQRDHHG